MKGSSYTIAETLKGGVDDMLDQLVAGIDEL